jgi:hypothetical protein
MHMLRCKPNEPPRLDVVGSGTAPNLATQSHPNSPVPLFLDGRKVLTVLLVALIPAAYLDLEEVHSNVSGRAPGYGPGGFVGKR